MLIATTSGFTLTFQFAQRRSTGKPPAQAETNQLPEYLLVIPPVTSPLPAAAAPAIDAPERVPTL